MKALLVYNETSGRGHFKKKFPLIKQELASSFDEMLFLCPKDKDEAREIYRNESSKFDALIVIGGDGSLNVAINELMALEKKPILGYINAGTLGDGGKTFGVNKSLKRSLEIIKQGKTRGIDIGKATDSKEDFYFLYCLAYGTYSSLPYEVKRRKKKTLGHFSYYLSSTKEMFIPSSLNYIVKTNNEEIEMKSPFILFLNGEYMGGFKLNKGSKVDDGRIEGYFPKQSLFNGILRFLPFKREDAKEIHEVIIKPEKDDFWCLDGEKGPFGEVKISVIKGAISIFSY